jgi:ATP-dependent Clp protease protease subunit
MKNNLFIFRFTCSYGIIEAKGNPPVSPAIMTPGGALDLSSVLFRNRIIFVGQPINSQVAQRVISQLLTLAAIDAESDILVCYVLIFCHCYLTYD